MMKMDTWYCAGWSRELGSAPLGRRLLGRHVALFRDADGTARALSARCPHRGADLARGALIDGGLECPFHGWRFNGLGQCTRVPSQPETMKVSTRARVPSFPLQERHGVLWIWMGDGGASNGATRDRVGEPDASSRRLFFDAHLVAAPFLDVLENFFDKAHLPFIHTGSFGADQDPLVARQRITIDADGRGLRAEDDPACLWHTEPKLPKGVIGVLARLFLGLRDPVAQHTRFDVEGGAQIYLKYPAGTYDRFVTHLTPADEGHTWLFVQSLRARARHLVGDWIQRRAINKIFAEGRRETSLVLEAGPDDAALPVSVESDRLGLAARQLYERWAQGSAACEDQERSWRAQAAMDRL